MSKEYFTARANLRQRLRQHPPERLDEQVVDCLLHYRDEPPEELGRTPGPKALLYYLPRAQDWQELGVRLPRSSSTIYRIRKRGGSYLVPTPSSCRSFPLA